MKISDNHDGQYFTPEPAYVDDKPSYIAEEVKALIRVFDFAREANKAEAEALAEEQRIAEAKAEALAEEAKAVLPEVVKGLAKAIEESDTVRKLDNDHPGTMDCQDGHKQFYRLWDTRYWCDEHNRFHREYLQICCDSDHMFFVSSCVAGTKPSEKCDPIYNREAYGWVGFDVSCHKTKVSALEFVAKAIDRYILSRGC